MRRVWSEEEEWFRVLAGEGGGGNRRGKVDMEEVPKEELSQDVNSESLALSTVSFWSRRNTFPQRP